MFLGFRAAMMMNHTKSAVVYALHKLRFKGIPTSTKSFSISRFPGFESAHPLASVVHPIGHSGYTTSNRRFAECEPRPSFVDEFTHLLEVVTEHADHNDCSEKNCVSFITSLLNALIFEDRIREAYMLFKTSIRSSHFSGVESASPLASLVYSKPNIRYLYWKKNSMNMDKEMSRDSNYTNPLSFVDELNHLLEIVTKYTRDEFFKQNRVPFITTFLDGLIFEDRVQEAYMLLNKLIEQNICEPTTLMYNTVIKALCNKPDVTMMDDAVKLFQEMVSQPDVVTYNSLVSGFSKMRCWTKAILLVKEMLDKDISPDVETFNVLIDTFCIEGRLQVARHVIYMMHERGIFPNAATYNPIIDVHCLIGEMSEARSLLNLMVSSHVAPDTTTYNSLLIGYCDHGMLNDAMLVHHEMDEQGFKPNWVTYNIMIRSCFKAARFGDAHILLDELLAQGQMLGKASYSYILYYLCHHCQFEEAFSLYHLLGDHSKLNSHLYVVEDLMYGAIRCGKLDIARELFEGLAIKGLKPTSATYTMMIGGFCSEGLLNDANQLFLEMEKKFCWPTDNTYNVLLKGYLKNKCYDDVEMLLHKMEEGDHCLYDLTLSLLRESIVAGSLDTSILELMNNISGSKDVDFP